MQDLTPERLAEKIKQLLNGGVELEDIQRMALAQGVDEIVFAEALDVIQGKSLTDDDSEEDETSTVPSNKNKHLILFIVGAIVFIGLIFGGYLFWQKNQIPEKVEEVGTVVLNAEEIFAINNEIDFLEGEEEALTEIITDIIDSQDENIFYDLEEDFDLSGVQFFEDLDNPGSSLVAEEEFEDEEETIEEELLAEIEVGRFEIAGMPRTVQPGAPSEVTVSVYDLEDQLIPNYQGTVEFRSTALDVDLPSNYTFSLEDEGKAKFKVVFNSLGKHTFVVNEKDNTTKRAQVTVRIR